MDEEIIPVAHVAAGLYSLVEFVVADLMRRGLIDHQGLTEHLERWIEQAPEDARPLLEQYLRHLRSHHG